MLTGNRSLIFYLITVTVTTVTSWFSISTDGDVINFQATQAALSQADFYGKTYEFQIKVRMDPTERYNKIPRYCQTRCLTFPGKPVYFQSFLQGQDTLPEIGRAHV